MAWRKRDGNDNIPLGKEAPDYGANSDNFTIMMHHSGLFCEFGCIVYARGEIAYFDYCNVDEISMIEVKSMAKLLGIDVDKATFYYNRKNPNDCSDLCEMKTDVHALELGNYISEERIVGVYIDSTEQSQSSSTFPEVEEVLGLCGDLEFTGVVSRVDGPSNLEIVDTVDCSDAEQSIGDDSCHSENLHDSDNEAKDVEVDVDIQVSWGGLECTEIERIPIPKESTNIHGHFPVFNPNVDMQDPTPTFRLGVCFPNTEILRSSIRQYSILHARDLQFTRNDKDRIKVICKHTPCPWKLYASNIPGEDTMQIKTVHNIHECTRAEKVTAANSSNVASNTDNLVDESEPLPNTQVSIASPKMKKRKLTPRRKGQLEEEDMAVQKSLRLLLLKDRIP